MHSPLALFGSFGPAEILVVLAILVLIFGERRLPELGRSLGEGIRNFRGSIKEMSDDSPDSEKKSDR